MRIAAVAAAQIAGGRAVVKISLARRIALHRPILRLHDVTAEAAEAFANVPSITSTRCMAFAFADTATVRAVQADGMDLIAISHRSIALGEIADRITGATSPSME